MSGRSRATPWWSHSDNFGRRCAEFANRRWERVMVDEAYAAGTLDERARIVAWLRTDPAGYHVPEQTMPRALADAIEKGVHVKSSTQQVEPEPLRPSSQQTTETKE